MVARPSNEIATSTAITALVTDLATVATMSATAVSEQDPLGSTGVIRTDRVTAFHRLGKIAIVIATATGLLTDGQTGDRQTRDPCASQWSPGGDPRTACLPELRPLVSIATEIG